MGIEVNWNWVLIQYLSMMSMIVPRCSDLNPRAPEWYPHEREGNSKYQTENTKRDTFHVTKKLSKLPSQETPEKSNDTVTHSENAPTSTKVDKLDIQEVHHEEVQDKVNCNESVI